MNVSMGRRWEGFVDQMVKEGRYGSASEVVREGLRLVEERETKRQALRETLTASIARGGENGPDDIEAAIERTAEELRHDAFTGRAFRRCPRGMLA